MLNAYTSFLTCRRADLQRIARATRGESTAEDIGQSVWLMAHELAERHGRPFDLQNLADQELLLSCLYNRFVRYTEKAVRYAVRIDEDPEDEAASAGAAIARMLSAPVESDPLICLERAEETAACSNVVRRSYSEAAAYLVLLLRFRWNVQALAEALRIVVSTLQRRFGNAADVVRVQPSLFDGIERIDPDLPAIPGWAAPFRGRELTPDRQQVFEF